MREIKFRGRDEHGDWHYGAFMGVFYDGVVAPIEYANIYDDGMANRVLPNTVGQFAGLLDSKGKEIYEGDIVKCDSGRICKVVFFTSASACCFDLIPVGGFDCEPPKKSTLWKGLTVIGNVHDNPDLLKEGGE